MTIAVLDDLSGEDRRDGAAGSGTTTAPLTFAVRRSFAEAEATWRALERGGTLSTYQRFDWVEPWWRHVGRRNGVDPALVIGLRDGRPAFLMPFGVRSDGVLTVAGWLGDGHSNYNLGVFAPGEMAALDQAGVRACLKALSDACRVDSVVLPRQPGTWNGVDNPFVAHLPSSRSPSNGYASRLTADFDALLEAHNGSHKRKKMRQKMRQFAAAGNVELDRARDADEAIFVLDDFFEQKAARFAEMGIADCFAEPGVQDFYHELAKTSASGDGTLLRVDYLRVGGKIRAIGGRSIHDGHSSLLFMSFANDDLARLSPGETLVYHLMELACTEGLDFADFGVGEERYKESWCDVTVELWDSHLAVSTAGWLLNAALGARDRIKRSIKQNPTAWDLYKKVRRLRGSAA